METNGELLYLWNSLVCIMPTKSICGKIILIFVPLRRKKYSRAVIKLVRTRITNTVIKKIPPTLPCTLYLHRKCSLLSKFLILQNNS